MLRTLATALLALALLQGQAASGASLESQARKQHEEWMAAGGRYPDEELQAYVNRVGQQLVAQSSLPDLDWQFTVLDSDGINALAAPGGYVYIYRGLLAYLDNEAELAGVLGHEIAHVTERHAARQKSSATTSKILAQAAWIFTGSRDLAEAGNIYSQGLIKGYGREFELEADRVGARLMSQAGYDPYELLEVVRVLMNDQRYREQDSNMQSRVARAVNTTHPRNEARLQEVLQAAVALEDAPPELIDGDEFRTRINGMTWGKSPGSERDPDRFYHNKLRFSFEKPAGWDVESGRKAVVAQPADGGGSVSITLQRRSKTVGDREVLTGYFGTTGLRESAVLEQSGLTGYTAVAPAGDGDNQRRLAMLNYGGATYLFEGKVDDDGSFADFDTSFLQIVETFRPMAKREREAGKAMELVYIRADDDTTFAGLARQSPVRDAEDTLRLINGYYPRGEPPLGEYIKIIRQVENPR